LNQSIPTHAAGTAAPIETRLSAAGVLGGSPHWLAPPAKYEVPPDPPIQYVRERLLTPLRSVARAPVTAIIGPAGSGKTTLMSYWARAGPPQRPLAWLALDSDDNTPEAFWSHMWESLRRGVPGLGLDAASTLRIDWTTIARLATALSDHPDPVVLVLDNAEALKDQAIGATLGFFLQHSGARVHLVVVGRGTGCISLDPNGAAGDIVEIGPADLKCTMRETGDVLRAYGVELIPEEIAALHESTEGWITAVCLHALALRAGSRYPSPKGRQAVVDFLRAEIFEAQPARVRDLLLRTSILDDVDVDLADLLTGRRDARGCLAELTRSQAFVTHVEGSRFRYHRALRSMLTDALLTTHPDLPRRLHDVAAQWYAGQRSMVRAVSHAIQASDWATATRIAIEELGAAWLLTAPEAEGCLDPLYGLPNEPAGSGVELLRAILALTRYDTAQARVAVDRAARRANLIDTPSAVLLGISIVEVILARLAGDVDAAEAAAVRADALCAEMAPGSTTPEVARARSLVLSNVGVARMWAGRLDEAREALERAARSTEPGTEFGAYDALAHLAMLRMYDGQMHQADKDARESLAIAERGGMRPSARSGAANATLAAIALVWNDLPAARRHTAAAISATGSRRDPPTAATLALVRAWAAGARHDGRMVIAATDTARTFLSRHHAAHLITDRIELTALWGHLLVGDREAARGCADRIVDPAEHAVALGYVLEAEGDQERARSALVSVYAHNARPSTLQYAALALGRLAIAEGSLPTAATALRQALDHGRPERRRRAVSDAGDWTRSVLRERADLLREHGWLTQRADAAAGRRLGAESLTDRETEVLQCLADAMSTKDIADTLCLSVNTVKTHLKSIYRKLGTAGRSATARRARELNLVPRGDLG
jgi:LuxR family transcriptional regulator, maltose regulon positive regulatory protein